MAKNIETAIKGNTLTITVDISKELGLSASEKNMKIATSGGGRGVELDVPASISKDETIAVSLNVYKRA